ncbi:AraC family transcriptional regulator [Tomitella fengzijianii]|uniref:AraC family transcriptional regulator n=2 Tax=Tomitella fengzijianii TaxID=2597660 RepID=A0A516X769_9ACTN|nr:AraC family transcriptional regulator [Tomitella fengzijianii]QDQ98914.1 AraC family transcriptional regulator [Tomitella fengzijianii]
MASAILTRHRLLATTDVDEARERVAGEFCPHVLTPTRRDATLDMLYNSVQFGGDLKLNYLRYGAEVRINPGTFDDFYLVQIPLAGAARVRVGDHVVASDTDHASVGSPSEPVDMVWSADCEQLLVYLRSDAVAALSPDGAEPVFQPMLYLQAPAVRSWLRMVRLAVDEADTGGNILGSQHTATHFARTLISGLLDAQASSAPDDADTPDRIAGSRAVRVALGLMADDAARPWRLQELAAAAGVSARSLQDAFRRELGVPPMQELRRIRLDRVRRELQAGTPSSTSVTDTAARWGLFHLGRFAQHYRSTYGELPSQTLAG